MCSSGRSHEHIGEGPFSLGAAPRARSRLRCWHLSTGALGHADGTGRSVKTCTSDVRPNAESTSPHRRKWRSRGRGANVHGRMHAPGAGGKREAGQPVRRAPLRRGRPSVPVVGPGRDGARPADDAASIRGTAVWYSCGHLFKKVHDARRGHRAPAARAGQRLPDASPFWSKNRRAPTRFAARGRLADPTAGKPPPPRRASRPSPTTSAHRNRLALPP